MTFTPYPVSQLVPHRLPLLLVDEIIAHGPGQLRTRLWVRDEPPFGDGAGGVPAYIGIEYMAQSVAAYSGWQRRERGRAPVVALLLGARHYRALPSHFAHGQQLQVQVLEKLSEYADLNVFTCRIEDAEGQLLAEADIKAYQPESIHQFLDQQA